MIKMLDYASGIDLFMFVTVVILHHQVGIFALSNAIMSYTHQLLKILFAISSNTLHQPIKDIKYICPHFGPKYQL